MDDGILIRTAPARLIHRRLTCSDETGAKTFRWNRPRQRISGSIGVAVKANGGARLTQPVVAVLEPEPSRWRSLARRSGGGGCLLERLEVEGTAWATCGGRIAPRAPDYFRSTFLQDALAPGVREAGLLRREKKCQNRPVSAVLILAHLAEDGPLRSPGWRCGAASLSREKSAELWTQCRDIATASGLRTLFFGKVPRCIESPWFGRVDFLSADRGAGHASGFDLAVADELGLFPEKGRDLVAGLLSATSARDGRLLAISVIGDSPLSVEMIARAGDPGTVVHVHQAPAELCFGPTNPRGGLGIRL